jgi:cyclase
MLAKRIIPCLDVRGGRVVKGTRFRDHKDVGDCITLAKRYAAEGADELVFYDIAASAEGRAVEPEWVTHIGRVLDIPFCVAGGIRSVDEARARLFAGADKISINTPALQDPDIIDRLAREFGSQCVVLGIDSRRGATTWEVHQFTGDPNLSAGAGRQTIDWVREGIERGAGEIVLNCMDQDGVRQGYDLEQLQAVRDVCTTPLIASGGAGRKEDFKTVFNRASVDGALAASVFHSGKIGINALKAYLFEERVGVRL